MMAAEVGGSLAGFCSEKRLASFCKSSYSMAGICWSFQETWASSWTRALSMGDLGQYSIWNWESRESKEGSFGGLAEDRPCLVAFWEEAALPSGERGPVERRALARLAAALRIETSGERSRARLGRLSVESRS